MKTSPKTLSYFAVLELVLVVTLAVLSLNTKCAYGSFSGAATEIGGGIGGGDDLQPENATDEVPQESVPFDSSASSATSSLPTSSFTASPPGDLDYASLMKDASFVHPVLGRHQVVKEQTREDELLFAASSASYSGKNSDVYVAFFVDFCRNPAMFQTYLHSAAWISDRLNFLQYFQSLKLGYFVFRTCDETDMLSAVFRLHREKADQHALLGIVTQGPVSTTVKEICNILKITLLEIPSYHGPVIQAAISLVNTLEWQENLTVIAPDSEFLEQFYEEAAKDLICVSNGFIYSPRLNFPHSTITNLVIFANAEEIQNVLALLHNNRNYDIKVMAVPTDGGFSKDLPETSFIIKTLQIDYTQPYKKSSKILPSSVLLETAVPILKLAQPAIEILKNACNDTVEKTTCLQQTSESLFQKHPQNQNAKHLKNTKHQFYAMENVMEILDIQPLQDKFVYNIFTVDHLNGMENPNSTSNITFSSAENMQIFAKIATYSIFNRSVNFQYKNSDVESYAKNQNLSFTFNGSGPGVNSSSSCWNVSMDSCYQHCINFKKEPDPTVTSFSIHGPIFIRREAWVLAVLTIAILGITLCFAIFMFLVVSICKRDSLEGNPTLTMFLLVAVIFTYVAVSPFAVTTDEEEHMEKLCLFRALSVTMTYTAVFSLMLSRCILLASVAIESEFMSHIPGPVQAIICLLMVAVQAALNVQLVVGSCRELISGDGYLYFLAYDVLLLATFLCCTPLVVKSQRNYREGKYFMFTVVFLIIGWTLWICAYLLLDDHWNDLVLCSGLLYTASVCLGTIFIPRTYLMTSAATRDRLTGTFPSLTTSSALDLYHTPGTTCHVYDCVNVTAINAAVAASRNNTMTNGTINALNNANSAQTLRVSEIYEPPVHILEGDVDRYSVQGSNSVSTDKITRF